MRRTVSCLVAVLFALVPLSLQADDDIRHRIKHVFVIVLENEGYEATFGPNSKAPYLSQSLTSQGVLLSQYYGTGHVSLDNYLAMLSGQAATPQTRSDCHVYADFVQTGLTPDGQAIGTGCVYPAGVKTLPDQLDAVGKTWKAYMGDMGNDPTREAATCGHPVLNAVDHTQSRRLPRHRCLWATSTPRAMIPSSTFTRLSTRRPASSALSISISCPKDLKSEFTTPNFVFITPNLCDDGHDLPCVTGAPGGLVSADAFLQKWIPLITTSPAYQRDGLIVITFDEGGLSEQISSSGISILAPGLFCCNEQPGPNLAPFPQTTNITPTITLTFESYGGDRTGAVLLSPFLKPGTVSETPFNHYSLLKSLEDIFDTEGHLSYAAAPGLVGFFGCVSSDIATKEPGFNRCPAN